MTKRPPYGAIAAVAVVVLLSGGGAGWWYRTSRPDYQFDRGREAARTGDFVRAERHAAELEESGQTDLGLLLRGEIEFHRGNPARALGFLGGVKGEGEMPTRAALLTAQCLIALKNPREAEKVLLFVLSQNPDHVDAHRWLAIIYYDQGDLRHTIPQLEQVAALDPADERAHFMLGTIYKDMEQPGDAIAAFQESLRRKPNGPKSVETRLALAEAQIKGFREADVEKTIEGLTSPHAVLLRAEALIGLGRIPEAVAQLDAALAASPDDHGLLRVRGERYRNDGDAASAAKLLERAIALDPDDHRARYQLALCYETLGRSKEAAELQREVKRTQAIIEQLHELGNEAMRDPWNPAVRDKLADLCDQLHRPKLAEMWRAAAAACRTGRPGPAAGPR